MQGKGSQRDASNTGKNRAHHGKKAQRRAAARIGRKGLLPGSLHQRDVNWGSWCWQAALRSAAACWSTLQPAGPPAAHGPGWPPLRSGPRSGLRLHHRPLSFLAICWRQAGSALKAARSLPNTCRRASSRRSGSGRAARPAGQAPEQQAAQARRRPETQNAQEGQAVAARCLRTSRPWCLSQCGTSHAK